MCSWQTRAPYKGWVPFRRLTAARGAALSSEVQQAADEIKQAPPAQEQRGVPGLSVKTADGFIVDVTNTTDGRVALIAAPDAAGKPDFTKPLTQVLASDLPNSRLHRQPCAICVQRSAALSASSMLRNPWNLLWGSWRSVTPMRTRSRNRQPQPTIHATTTALCALKSSAQLHWYHFSALN